MKKAKTMERARSTRPIVPVRPRAILSVFLRVLVSVFGDRLGVRFLWL